LAFSSRIRFGFASWARVVEPAEKARAGAAAVVRKERRVGFMNPF
jgi:hypothetical protein